MFIRSQSFWVGEPTRVVMICRIAISKASQGVINGRPVLLHHSLDECILVPPSLAPWLLPPAGVSSDPDHDRCRETMRNRSSGRPSVGFGIVLSKSWMVWGFFDLLDILGRGKGRREQE